MACTLQATIGGKFAPLIGLRDEDMDINTMITTYNIAVVDAAGEIQSNLLMCSPLLRVGCLGLNGPFRQYFSLHRAVSQR